MTRIPSAMIVICAAVLAVLSGAAVYAQDKYALKSPSGIAFSDFKGYEDWAVVSSGPDRRSAQGDRCQSDHDRGVQGRRSRQWPTFPGWLQDREASVEAEEEHGGSLRRGCARRLHAGFRDRKGQREISGKRRMGTRCSTTKLHPTSSRPIPAPRIADTRAMWP